MKHLLVALGVTAIVGAAGASAAPAQLTTQRVASGLSFPDDATYAPGDEGRLLIVEHENAIARQEIDQMTVTQPGDGVGFPVEDEKLCTITRRRRRLSNPIARKQVVIQPENVFESLQVERIVPMLRHVL